MIPTQTRLQPKTSTLHLLAYSGPAVPLSMMMLMLIVYIPPFYALELGMDMGAIGFIFLLARAWDALIDPVIGNFSDRTRSRFGRRKPWIAIGTPGLMFLLWAFCMPPENITVFYLGAVAFIFYVALTSVQIPYLSWGAELSRDYKVRTKINGFREAGTMIGTLCATAVPLWFLRGSEPSLRDILGVFTMTVLILLPVSVFLALRFTPKREEVPVESPSLIKSLSLLKVNLPARRILTGIFFLWLGGAVYNAMALFVVDRILELPNSMFLVFVFVQYAVSFLGLPIWVRLANRYSRHKMLVIGSMAFLGALPLFLVIPAGNPVAASLLFALLGLVTSVIWVMPPALISDTIEYGIFKGLTDDSAIYMALYYFVQKMALAVGVGVALPLAGIMGFNPVTGGGEAGRTALSFVALFLPVALALPGAYLLFNHPIDRRRHEIIRKWMVRKGLT